MHGLVFAAHDEVLNLRMSLTLQCILLSESARSLRPWQQHLIEHTMVPEAEHAQPAPKTVPAQTRRWHLQKLRTHTRGGRKPRCPQAVSNLVAQSTSRVDSGTRQ